MSELNDLETQLRSWVPRRPSADLQARIFAVPHGPAAAPSDPELLPAPHSFHLHWLAPATVAMLFLCVLFNPRGNFQTPGVHNEFIAVALSNQSAAAWLPGSFAVGQNSLPAETFEWTNGSRSNSSVTPITPVRGTN